MGLMADFQISVKIKTQLVFSATLQSSILSVISVFSVAGCHADTGMVARSCGNWLGFWRESGALKWRRRPECPQARRPRPASKI